ncbi:MAG TPA: TonB-dependent receptor, partial [Solirubrobacteraceae bacterium]
PISGAFNVREAFTEMRLPLASHQTGAEDLSLEGGYRYSKYSEGFTTNTYKIGLEWAPVRDVRVRGGFNRAVRAPNIGELFAPQAVGLDGSVDPCAAAYAAGSPLAPNPAAILANNVTFAQCAPSGVTAAQFGHILPNSAPQYNGKAGGNPNLLPEVADTYTVGLVLQPRMAPNLTLSFDYFDIKIKNVIGAIGGNNIINDCIFRGLLCNQVNRDATGSLWRSQNGYVIDTTVNEGALKTEGLDVKGSYRQPLPQLGSLLFSLEGTKLKSLQTTPVAGGSSYDCEGFWGPICGGGNPNWRSVFNVAWSTPWDGLDLNVRWRYFGPDELEFLSPVKPLNSPGAYLPLAHIPAYSWVDLSATFGLYKNVKLQLGVNNIADKVPPLAVGSACTTSSGAGNSGANCNGNTFPGVYDSMGRYLFATLTAQW